MASPGFYLRCLLTPPFGYALNAKRRDVVGNHLVDFDTGEVEVSEFGDQVLVLRGIKESGLCHDGEDMVRCVGHRLMLGAGKSARPSLAIQCFERSISQALHQL